MIDGAKPTVLKWNGLPTGQFYKTFPESQINKTNKLSQVGILNKLWVCFLNGNLLVDVVDKDMPGMCICGVQIRHVVFSWRLYVFKIGGGASILSVLKGAMLELLTLYVYSCGLKENFDICFCWTNIVLVIS